ncbi:DNA polymerase alpha subunit B isoform X2 [Aethina tumida]|uniref:DNA polymerase alpha subunit B isoform X2 n=1 Tax=Aethina tumida TaxID=116153 RepID=UPI0021497E3F|nr:DNA polymerase alpha subunit B isoform X2 [Aethina tumida]
MSFFFIARCERVFFGCIFFPFLSNKNFNNVRTPDHPRRLQSTSLNFESQETTNIYSSPAQTKSQSNAYSQRSDSRAVLCTHGDPTATYTRTDDIQLFVRMFGDEEHSLTSKSKYMYEIMGSKARYLSIMTEWLGDFMLKKHNLTLSEGSLKSFTGPMTTFGRIVSDSDGKINVQSTLLEGSQLVNFAHTVSLNLNKVPKYSLFPGQVVMVEGNNAHNGTFFADKIISDALPTLPLEPPNFYGTMQIMIASGPFTLPSNLSYEPLNDLLKYAAEYQPHLLILLGPFLDTDHEGILNGQLTDPFVSFFESLIENIAVTLQDVDTQVVIVASSKDAHHDPVYPTPPYCTRGAYEKIRFVPDPCMLDVNGLVIGATSADVLFDISNFELYQDRNPSGPVDRLGRLASHLLQQQSFYPLYPPSKDMCIDHELLEQHGFIEYIPHILILPSTLRYFIKNISGCLVINPERSTKGYGAGTFAKVEIKSGTSNSICSRASCQILRV